MNEQEFWFQFETELTVLWLTDAPIDPNEGEPVTTWNLLGKAA